LRIVWQRVVHYLGSRDTLKASLFSSQGIPEILAEDALRPLQFLTNGSPGTLVFGNAAGSRSAFQVLSHFSALAA
jgi:hypothetical protein